MKTNIIIGLVSSAALGFATEGFSKTFLMPTTNNDIVGEEYTITAQRGDTMYKIAERHEISLHELEEANPQLNSLRPGQNVLIPGKLILPPRDFRAQNGKASIVVNIAELRLYYFTEDGQYVMTYPVGLGRRDWRTPTASASITRKAVDPTWYVPESIFHHVYQQTGRVLPEKIPGGVEDNPLGPRAIYMSKHGYLIHGTNQPWTIGKYVSSGCIRMRNENVTELYEYVQPGTKVYLVHLPQKAGWQDGKLYLEAQKPVDLPKEDSGKLNHDSVNMAIQSATTDRQANIDWARADEVVRQRLGTPQLVGQARLFEGQHEEHAQQQPVLDAKPAHNPAATAEMPIAAQTSAAQPSVDHSNLYHRLLRLLNSNNTQASA